MNLSETALVPELDTENCNPSKTEGLITSGFLKEVDMSSEKNIPSGKKKCLCAAYANGWYDKSRDDGLRFWAAQPHSSTLPASHRKRYLQGMWDRPHSGLRGVNFRTRSTYNPLCKVA
jgi:hypothetical protein